MKTLRHITPLILALSIGCTTAQAASLEDIAPYPKAEDGFIRQAIHLPEKPQEDLLKVQIVSGKTIDVDCNRHGFGGDLTEKRLAGWEYPYYRLEKAIGPFSSRMGCPSQETRREFVKVEGNGYLLDYNSKLPIVIYVPKDIEVRYRVWSTDDTLKNAISQ